MMKFSGSVEINASVEKVTAYFIDPVYLGEYQDGFVRKELLEGEKWMQQFKEFVERQ